MHVVLVSELAAGQRMIIQNVSDESPLISEHPKVPLYHLHFSEGWLVGDPLVLSFLDHFVKLPVFSLGRLGFESKHVLLVLVDLSIEVVYPSMECLKLVFFDATLPLAYVIFVLLLADLFLFAFAVQVLILEVDH